MPTCDCCAGYDEVFDERTARRELRSYQRHGPRRTTRLLLQGLTTGAPMDGASLLDVGSGIGAIAHELVRRGTSRVTVVDASRAYLRSNEAEAQRQGYASRARYVLGDFVTVGREVEPADFVTLDRVICCYPDMPGLVRVAAEKAQRRLGLVLPRDDWWVRLGRRFVNLVLRMFGSPFRTFIHRPRDVAAAITARGLRPILRRRGLVWQVEVYERPAPVGSVDLSSPMRSQVPA